MNLFQKKRSFGEKRSKKFRSSLRSPLGGLASLVAPLATLPHISDESFSKHFFHKKRALEKLPTCCNVMWWARSFAQNPLKHDPTPIWGGDRKGSAGAWRLIEFCEVPVRPLQQYSDSVMRRQTSHQPLGMMMNSRNFESQESSRCAFDTDDKYIFIMKVSVPP